MLRGYVPASEFSALVAGSDICVSLRSPTLGETSASAIAALAAGTPLIVSDVGWFKELPDSVAAKVAPDEWEVAHLAALLELLASDADLRRKMGSAGRSIRPAGARCRALGRRICRSPGGSRRLTSSGPVVARSSLARTRTWIAAVPAWLWLGVLVLASAGIRLALAKPHPAPWIFPDELIYAHLAESFGSTGSFAIRDSPGLQGFGPGYPLLIAPAFAVFDDLAHAYAAAKAINAVVMSLAAIPVYLIARRLVPVWLALVAATLALAIPSFLYTGTILTENAFYPAFAAAAFGMFAALERPTLWRQLGALALIGVAFLIRAQAISLGAAFLTAIALVCLVEAWAEGRLSVRELERRLDAFRVTWVLSGVGILLVLGLAAARGSSPANALGGYGVLADSSHPPSMSRAGSSTTSRRSTSTSGSCRWLRSLPSVSRRSAVGRFPGRCVSSGCSRSRSWSG